MKQAKSTFILFVLLLTACATISSEQNVVTPEPVFTGFEIISTITPLPTITPIPCNPTSVDFCIVDGNFIFQNPLGSEYMLALARSYPYGSTDNGTRDPHRGVDYESEDGVSVFAPASGEVVFTGCDHKRIFSPWDDYYGNLVVIHHGEGLYTLYGHLSQVFVDAGEQVNTGDVIGSVGHSGVAIGSHLHFEVRRSNTSADFFSTQNPELWLMLPSGTGALSVTVRGNDKTKAERQLVISRFAEGTDMPEEKYYVSTYPKEFFQNEEDFARGNLPPGRYRIALTDETGLYDRIFNVEADKLTQVVIELK